MNRPLVPTLSPSDGERGIPRLRERVRAVRPGPWSQGVRSFLDWGRSIDYPNRRQVLDCASPPALFAAGGGKAAEDCRTPRSWHVCVASSRFTVPTRGLRRMGFSVGRSGPNGRQVGESGAEDARTPNAGASSTRSGSREASRVRAIYLMRKSATTGRWSEASAAGTHIRSTVIPRVTNT